MKLTLFPLVALVAFAPADAISGATGTSVVAEIITFRLNPGVADATFLAAAAKTKPFLRATGHVISRSLSQDETGLWTDYILWTDLGAAKTTAAKAMQSPNFAPFMSMISPDGMQMRHAPVRLRMD